MATGDQQDFLDRIGALIPGWFLSSAPIKDGLVTGYANVAAFIYSLLAYIQLQTRIKSATDGWLDLIAFDFFGLRIQRDTGQSDASLEGRIIAEIFRRRNTRNAIRQVVLDITGLEPAIFEPGRLADTGACNTTTAYYNTIGRWGSRDIPYQCFVTVTRGNESSDADIYAAIESVRAAGTEIWVQIVDAAGLTTEDGFGLETEGGQPIGA